MPSPEQPLITSVPGFENQPVDPGEQMGQPTAVEGFRGDPRRVIGHPGNPTNEAVAAYAQQLTEQGQAEVAPRIPADQASEWGAATLHGMGAETPAVAPQATEAPGPRFIEPTQPFNNAGSESIQHLRGKPQIVHGAQAPVPEKKSWFKK